MQFNIPEQDLAELFSAQVLNSLSEETKQSLIKSSISYLLAPQKSTSRYDKNKDSPIKESFNRAIEQLADSVVREYVESNSEIKKMLMDSMPKLKDLEYSKRLLVSQAFSEALIRIALEEDE